MRTLAELLERLAQMLRPRSSTTVRTFSNASTLEISDEQQFRNELTKATLEGLARWEEKNLAP